MQRFQVGDLVKHIYPSKNLPLGIITAIRGNIDEEGYACDVLWSCGRHSAHPEMWIRPLEASCK